MVGDLFHVEYVFCAKAWESDMHSFSILLKVLNVGVSDHRRLINFRDLLSLRVQHGDPYLKYSTIWGYSMTSYKPGDEKYYIMHYATLNILICNEADLTLEYYAFLKALVTHTLDNTLGQFKQPFSLYKNTNELDFISHIYHHSFLFFHIVEFNSHEFRETLMETTLPRRSLRLIIEQEDQVVDQKYYYGTMCKHVLMLAFKTASVENTAHRLAELKRFINRRVFAFGFIIPNLHERIPLIIENLASTIATGNDYYDTLTQVVVLQNAYFNQDNHDFIFG